LWSSSRRLHWLAIVGKNCALKRQENFEQLDKPLPKLPTRHPIWWRRAIVHKPTSRQAAGILAEIRNGDASKKAVRRSSL
jgi:hypothetical protein